MNVEKTIKVGHPALNRTQPRRADLAPALAARGGTNFKFPELFYNLPAPIDSPCRAQGAVNKHFSKITKYQINRMTHLQFTPTPIQMLANPRPKFI